MKIKKIICVIFLIGIVTLNSYVCFGFAQSIDLSMPVTTNGISIYTFGDTAKNVLGTPFLPSLVPGSHGEEFIMKTIKDSRFGFDSLHLGFTMESQRLCNIGLCRNFSYASSDYEMLEMVSNVHSWVKSSFGDAVKLNPAFDLHSPPDALYSSVEIDSLILQIRASHRQGPCWVMISLNNKLLEGEASMEYDRLSNNEAVRTEVEHRKKMWAWLTPLFYALPLYIICCLPVFLVLMVIYVIVMIRRQQKMRFIHWTDSITLLVAPYVWGFFEHVGQSKSLSNIVEFAIIGWVWCICMAIRYAMSIMQKKTFERCHGYLTFVIVILLSALLAIFFPGLPE